MLKNLKEALDRVTLAVVGFVLVSLVVIKIEVVEAMERGVVVSFY